MRRRTAGGGGGGKGSGDGLGDVGKGGNLVDAIMWTCSQCTTHSFLSRRTCFGCGAPKPVRPIIATARWPERLDMGNGAGTGAGLVASGARETEKLNPRVPILQWSKGTGDAKLKGKGGGKGRAGEDTYAAKKGKGGDREGRKSRGR